MKKRPNNVKIYCRECRALRSMKPLADRYLWSCNTCKHEFGALQISQSGEIDEIQTEETINKELHAQTI